MIAVVVSSCSSSKHLISGIQPSEMDELLNIGPFSRISFIAKGNQATYNDSISNEAMIVLNESLESLREKLPLYPQGIKITDSLERDTLEKEIGLILTAIDARKKKQNVPSTPMFDSLLTAHDKRFGLILAQSGFTRRKGNYGGQIAKGFALGLLTMGTFYTVPIKANSTIHAIIIDSQNHNVAFYRRSILQDKEPTQKKHLDDQLNQIFKNYFWEKP